MRSCSEHELIQVRSVPDELHRALKKRAAREGTTMSALIVRELPRLVYNPSPQQVLSRIRQRAPVDGPPAAELIAGERARRDAGR